MLEVHVGPIDLGDGDRSGDDARVDVRRRHDEVIGRPLAGVVDQRRLADLDVAWSRDGVEQVRDRVQIGIRLRVVTHAVIQRARACDALIEQLDDIAVARELRFGVGGTPEHRERARAGQAHRSHSGSPSG